jgi:tripartite ATP-independent transporter DctM subunit
MSIFAAPALPAVPKQASGALRVLDRVARWLEVASDQAVRIGVVGAILAALVAFGTIITNVFCRYILGFSLAGPEELSSYAFLWAIWMGVSVAVRRGAVTVISVISGRGPVVWQRSLKIFSSVALGVLLVYCVLTTTRYAISRESLDSYSSIFRIRQLYPIASMTIGYYFIALHYLAILANAGARLAANGRVGLTDAARPIAGALLVAGATWGACVGLLAAGAAKLLVLGVLFAVLTLAGTPVVFMLAMVGILSTKAIAGLDFYPNVDPLFPFRASQGQMGLNGASELVVILMFLIVAEVMNESGMSERLIHFAATMIGHLRGGMAYVCQLTSMMVSGISGSAQADAAIMTPLLVPAMESEGYPRDVAASVVAGASIKGPIGPISIMFIVYGIVVEGSNGAPIDRLALSGIPVQIALFLSQAAVIAWIVRRRNIGRRRDFAGMRAVRRSGASALPVLAVPVVILGGIEAGVFTPSESAAAALLVALVLAFFWYGTLTFRDIPRLFAAACVETGVVLLLLGDSAILSKNLTNNGFGQDLTDFVTGITDNKYVFLLLVNLLLLAVGIFIEPLPALYILAPFLAPIAVAIYGIDPIHFGLIMVFNLVLALIHPPIGLVLFLVSRVTKVPIERLSITILPWLAVSLVILFIVTFLPSAVITWFPNLFFSG